MDSQERTVSRTITTDRTSVPDDRGAILMLFLRGDEGALLCRQDLG